MSALNLFDHVSQLVTNDGVLDKLLTESFSLASIFKSFLVANSGKPTGAHVGAHSNKK
jgi:hypothetical protein